MSTSQPFYNLFWGDTHHNTYQDYTQSPAMEEILSFASTYLDFYTGAYYTPVMTTIHPRGSAPAPSISSPGHPVERESGNTWRGVHVEFLKDASRMRDQWQEFQQATSLWNQPGYFTAFPGYEWQGDGTSGDHNVICLREGEPIFTPPTIQELYTCLRGRDVLAIPHHTGYRVGLRAPDWSNTDEIISPFAEIFSIHGCSESDEEWIGLRRNSHMGPGAGAGTYQQALDCGLHLGAICSTDNWSNMPGCWGQGLMACLAENLSRASLWEAFKARRVYGVTGDRIRLDYTLNGAAMGSRLAHASRRVIHVAVEGADAIDRIELLRGSQVIATTCHQGQWQLPSSGQTSRYKLRIEAGWGPRPGELPYGEHLWQGELIISGGRITGWQPCWVNRGQSVPSIDGNRATFRMTSRQEQVPLAFQGGLVFEVEGKPESEVILQLNGNETRAPLATFTAASHILWYRDECARMLQEQVGIAAEELGREDPLYHFAFKAKFHRAIPFAGYCASLEYSDDAPLVQETAYRVRVEQRNGQKAWSSPIWVGGSNS